MIGAAPEPSRTDAPPAPKFFRIPSIQVIDKRARRVYSLPLRLNLSCFGASPRLGLASELAPPSSDRREASISRINPRGARSALRDRRSLRPSVWSEVETETQSFPKASERGGWGCRVRLGSNLPRPLRRARRGRREGASRHAGARGTTPGGPPTWTVASGRRLWGPTFLRGEFQ